MDSFIRKVLGAFLLTDSCMFRCLWLILFALNFIKIRIQCHLKDSLAMEHKACYGQFLFNHSFHNINICHDFVFHII